MAITCQIALLINQICVWNAQLCYLTFSYVHVVSRFIFSRTTVHLNHTHKSI